MKQMMEEVKEIAKHGEMTPKSFKVKMKFEKKDSKKRTKALEKAKKMHTVPH